MKEVVKKYNIRQFRFSDDMFTANKNRAIELCKLISQLDVVWRISCRVKPFDIELAQALYDAGCVEISFGIESGFPLARLTEHFMIDCRNSTDHA